MNRKFKVLGLALVAVFAMSAVMASAASAKNLTSNSVSGTTFLTGTQVGTNTFDLENGTTVKCTTAVFDASFPGVSTSEATVTPTYSGCTAAGQAATVDTAGCTYTITTPTQTTDNDHFDAVVHLVCSGANKIKVTVPTAGCTVEIGTQTPTNPIVDLTNVTTATANQDDILLTSTVTGVHYTTVGGGICGAAGQGKLTGEVTIRGYSNSTHATQVDLWID